MWSARPSFAPRLCAIVSVTSAGSRSEASPTQKTPALYSGTSVERRFQGEPGLPGAAGTRERDEAGSRFEPRHDLLELGVPAHEGARRTRQVGVRDRLERREAPRSQLEDRHRIRDVLQTMLSQVHELDIDDRGRCLGENDLAAVARRRRRERRSGRRRRRSPRRQGAGVPVCSPTRTLIGPATSISVKAEAASSAPGAVGNAKKKASPCVSTSTPPSAAHASRMTRRCSASASAYGLGAELVQQLRRPLDVGEQEGHRAGWKLRPHRGPNHEAVAARGLVTRVVALA